MHTHTHTHTDTHTHTYTDIQYFSIIFSFKESTTQQGCFVIHHFVGPVTYRAESLLEKNKQTISDDIIWLFSHTNCSFGFVTHLYTQELRQIQGNSTWNVCLKDQNMSLNNDSGNNHWYWFVTDILERQSSIWLVMLTKLVSDTSKYFVLFTMFDVSSVKTCWTAKRFHFFCVFQAIS